VRHAKFLKREKTIAQPLITVVPGLVTLKKT